MGQWPKKVPSSQQEVGFVTTPLGTAARSQTDVRINKTLPISGPPPHLHLLPIFLVGEKEVRRELQFVLGQMAAPTSDARALGTRNGDGRRPPPSESALTSGPHNWGSRDPEGAKPCHGSLGAQEAKSTLKPRRPTPPLLSQTMLHPALCRAHTRQGLSFTLPRPLLPARGGRV